MITTKEILKIADLSKIKLSKKESESLFKDLNDILDYVKKIHNYNISNVDKKNSIFNATLRDDKVIEFDGKFLINQFNSEKNSFLKTKKTF